MGTVVASYRQLVRAYPTGGGDYEVASKNIGRSAGVDRGQRATRRLRHDGRGVGVIRRRQHHLGVPEPELRTRTDGGRVRRAARRGEPARHPRSRPRVRRADLPVHDRRLPDDRHRPRPAGRRIAAGGRERALRRTRPTRLRLARRSGAGLSGAARVLLRLHRADRGRGDRERRAGLPAAEGEERAEDVADDGHHRDLDVRRADRARLDRQGALRRQGLRPDRPAESGRLHHASPAHGHRPGRVIGVRRRRIRSGSSSSRPRPR